MWNDPDYKKKKGLFHFSCEELTLELQFKVTMGFDSVHFERNGTHVLNLL
jgi:hypothetical protein